MKTLFKKPDGKHDHLMVVTALFILTSAIVIFCGTINELNSQKTNREPHKIVIALK